MKVDAAFRHNAFRYESEDDYVARSVGFVKEGLQAGEGAIVANTRDRLAIMREALGNDAERVAFVDIKGTYTRPARTVAAYYGTFLRELQKSPFVRAVADASQFGRTSEEWAEWTAYEAITNLAYAHLPGIIL